MSIAQLPKPIVQDVQISSQISSKMEVFIEATRRPSPAWPPGTRATSSGPITRPSVYLAAVLSCCTHRTSVQKMVGTAGFEPATP